MVYAEVLSAFYDVEIPTINEHINKIFSDYELELEAIIRNFPNSSNLQSDKRRWLMPELDDIEIPKPQNWQDFERLVEAIQG